MERNGMECELSSDLRNKLNGDSILTEFNDRRRFVWKKKRERAREMRDFISNKTIY